MMNLFIWYWTLAIIVGLLYTVYTWNRIDRTKNMIINYIIDVFMIMFGVPFFVIPMTLLDILKSKLKSK
jgi:hypothetical protein